MSKYVVRQPIKDRENNIFGYEILFQVENGSLYNQNSDYAAAESISSFLMQNNENVFQDKITFMTFTPNLLFKNTPKMFKQNDLVIQIEDNVIIHPLSLNLIQRFMNSGYKIAVNDFQFAPRYFSIMEFVDYIKVNFHDKNTSSLENIIKMGKGFKKKCIATGVDSRELYDLAMQFDVDYFQGTYVADIMMTKANKTEYLQSNFFLLLIAVTKDDPDMDEIEEIISRDATLTYAILKMVNSVYFALRRRTSSIKQALVILGIGQLKQWVYLLSFNQDGEGVSEELLKMSFLRANFCSNLLPYMKEEPISKSEAYLMGMFSTLNYLIDAPLEEILAEIPVVDEIKEALLNHTGMCGMLYDLVISYEKADWRGISKNAELLGIPRDIIAQVYFNCIGYVNEIWESLMNPYHSDAPEEGVPEGEEGGSPEEAILESQESQGNQEHQLPPTKQATAMKRQEQVKTTKEESAKEEPEEEKKESLE